MLVYLLCEVKYKNREDAEEEKLSIINSIAVIFFSSSCFIPQLQSYETILPTYNETKNKNDYLIGIYLFYEEQKNLKYITVQQ